MLTSVLVVSTSGAPVDSTVTTSVCVLGESVASIRVVWLTESPTFAKTAWAKPVIVTCTL